MNRRQRIKILFHLLSGLILVFAAGGVAFLQSERFAQMVKKVLRPESLLNLGLVGDFESIKIQYFPPGIGLVQPRVQIQPQNALKMPIHAVIECDALTLVFRPFQMISRSLEIENVSIEGGKVRVELLPDFFKSDPEPHKKNSIQLRWSDLFSVRLRGVEFKNSEVAVFAQSPQIALTSTIDHFEIRKESDSKRSGFVAEGLMPRLVFDLGERHKNIPFNEVTQFQGRIEFNPEVTRVAGLRFGVNQTDFLWDAEITGNALKQGAPLPTRAKAEVRGHLRPWIEKYSWAPNNADGSLYIKLEASGDLNQIPDSFEGVAEVEGLGLQWEQQNVDRLQITSKIDFRSKSLTQLRVEAEAKSDSRKTGQIKLTSEKLPFDLSFIDANIELNSATFKWLGGLVPRSMAPLEGKVSGEVRVNAPQGLKNGSEIDLDLKVDQFALTTESWEDPSLPRQILKPIHPIRVHGSPRLGQAGVDLTGTKISLPEIDLTLSGEITQKRGLQFDAEGPVNLRSIDTIAGSPIRGIGRLKVGVKGKAEDVHLTFGADLADAEYLDLKFGMLKGDIGLDLDSSRLWFQEIQAEYKDTVYGLSSGDIDLEAGDLNLPIVIRSGRVSDLLEMLARLTENISWLPRSLNGDLSGRVLVSGKTDTEKMSVAAQVEGRDWTWMGERAKSIRFDGGLGAGSYYLKHLDLTKNLGRILGGIEFDTIKNRMSWDFRTENFSLKDFDFYNRLEIPGRASVAIKSTGTGISGALVTQSELRFSETSLRGESLEDTQVKFESGEKIARTQVRVFGDQLVGSYRHAWVPNQPSELSAEFKKFDLSPLLMVFNPKLLDDPEFKSSLQGKMGFSFLSKSPELFDGTLEINEFVLKKANVKLGMDRPLKLPIQLGYFKIPEFYLESGKQRIKISGTGDRGNLNVNASGVLDLSLAEFFTSSIDSLSGPAEINANLTGTFSRPLFNADLEFLNARLLLRFLQTPFEDIEGAIRIRQDRIVLEEISAYLADEVVEFGGKIETYLDRVPALDLHAKISGSKVKLLPLENLQARGNIKISGSQLPYEISGNVDIAQGLYAQSFSKKSNGGAKSRFAPDAVEGQKSNQIFSLNIDANAPNGFWVRNDVMESEFKGKVRLLGPPDDLKMLGEANLIQGKVLFKDRPFVLESVKVEFDSPTVFDPKFNASAVSDQGQYKVRVVAFGRGSKWKAEFSSTPYLPEQEIFSLLTSGTTSQDTLRIRNRDRTYVNQGEAASLILHSLQFGQDVQKKTGFQFDVQEALDAQVGMSVFRPQTANENPVAPKVVLKRKLGRNLGLSVGSTVGVGAQNQREVSADYTLSPVFSVRGIWSSFEDFNTRDARTSFGLDLKFNRKFK